MSSLSIGVMMPTLNCAALLPAHLQSVHEWADLVEEIVVVDSDSTDGTVDYIKNNLRHPNVRVLHHPRGLYQSWNFGIRNVSKKYAYISTVGDSITRDGLLKLHKVAETSDFDAVVSKPNFVSNDGKPVEDVPWPIDDLLQYAPRREFVVLEGALFHLLAAADLRGALLGSSASNLYRTELMQKKPFPTDFGTTGDQAWTFMYGLDSRIAMVRGRFSTFRFHPKAYAASEYAVPDLEDRAYALALKTLTARARESKMIRADTLRLGAEQYIRSIMLNRAAVRKLEAMRLSAKPLFPVFQDTARWFAERQRDASAKKILELKTAALEELRARQQGQPAV
jgi:glycosyltransferase involved in cell wall biosynthesis